MSAGAHASAITAPTSTNGAIWAAISAVRPASEPTAQNRKRSSVATSINRIAVVTDPRNTLIAAPASESLTGVAPRGPSEPIA